MARAGRRSASPSRAGCHSTAAPTSCRSWTGYLIQSFLDYDGEPVDKFRLAGTFTQVEEDGADHAGGWYATIDRAAVQPAGDWRIGRDGG